MDIYFNLIPELQLIVEYWYKKLDLHSRLHKAQDHLEKNFIRHQMSHRNYPYSHYSLFEINETTMIMFELCTAEAPIYARVVTILVEGNLFEIRETHCTKKIVDKTKTFTSRNNSFACLWPIILGSKNN